MLVLGSVLVASGWWVLYEMVQSGLTADLLKYQEKPPGGWALATWKSLRRALPGIIISVLILMVPTVFVTHRWVVFLKAKIFYSPG